MDVGWRLELEVSKNNEKREVSWGTFRSPNTRRVFRLPKVRRQVVPGPDVPGNFLSHRTDTGYVLGHGNGSQVERIRTTSRSVERPWILSHPDSSPHDESLGSFRAHEGSCPTPLECLECRKKENVTVVNEEREEGLTLGGFFGPEGLLFSVFPSPDQ